MYILATAHVSLVLVRLINAFIFNGDTPDGAIIYLANIAIPVNRSKDMIYVTLIVLGDSILVWRCFMVWSRNYYVIAFPCIMVLGTAISGYGAVGQYYLPDPFTVTAVNWATSLLIVSMATNIVVTLLTAGRIWAISRKLSQMTYSSAGGHYRQILLLIIESGVVITCCKMLEFILFELSPNGLVGLNALYVLMDSMPQIMGICPTLIILAVNQGYTRPETSMAGSSKGTYASSASRLGSTKVVLMVNQETIAKADSHAYPLGSMPSREQV